MAATLLIYIYEEISQESRNFFELLLTRINSGPHLNIVPTLQIRTSAMLLLLSVVDETAQG